MNGHLHIDSIARLRRVPDIPPSLRGMVRWVRGALLAGADKDGFRPVHYSIQSNHLDLIAEGEPKRLTAVSMA